MYITGLLKRIAPFFIALALGLFAASFFVSIALPNVRPVRKLKAHREYHRQMEFENRRLKMENCRLKREAAQMKADRDFNFESAGVNELVPPPPPIPVAPRSFR